METIRATKGRVHQTNTMPLDEETSQPNALSFRKPITYALFVGVTLLYQLYQSQS